MRPLMATLAMIGLMLAPAVTADAQPEALLLYAFEPGCFANCGVTVMRVAPDTPAVLSSVVDRSAQTILRPYVTPDGRWLIWAADASTTGSVRLAVRDLVDSVTQTLSAQGRLLFGNPARPELYIADQNGVFSLGPHGTRRFGGLECAAGFEVGASGDGRRIVLNCQGTPGIPAGTRVFEVESGQLVGVMPPVIVGAADVPGRFVFAVDQLTGPPRLQRYDVATGLVVAEVPVPVVPVAPSGYVAGVLFDADRHRVLVVTGEALLAFDATTLALLGASGPVGGPALDESIVNFSFDDVSSRLYVVTSAPVGATVSYVYRVFDTARLAQTLVVPNMVLGQFAALPAPRAPVGVTASVTGGAVSLTWSPSNPHAVTRFVLEAGSGPGRADIVAGLDVGLQTSLQASGVPPGTYYVRVRAGNFAGLSAPSSDVVVRVP